MMLAGRSAKDRNQIGEYIEGIPPDEKPLINLWRNPESNEYPTRRILATLRFEGGDDLSPYWGVLRTAAMLRDYALSRMTVDEISVRWGFKADIEGRLLPTVSWLLNALANICAGDRCYRLDFLRMRIFALIQNLSVGGGLGKILGIKGVGIRTVEKLKATGIRSLDDLEQSTTSILESTGISRRQLTEIKKTMARIRR